MLKARGFKAGDRTIIYMPMVPEAAIAMLACARLGITHSVVFGGFSAEALKARIQDLGATLVITADGGWRRGKEVRLKPAVDEALAECPDVRRRDRPRAHRRRRHDAGRAATTGGTNSSRTSATTARLSRSTPSTRFTCCTRRERPANRKAFCTPQPAICCSARSTMKWVFDLKDDDVYWCTADIGWVTGHSYVVYGPLSRG